MKSEENTGLDGVTVCDVKKSMRPSYVAFDKSKNEGVEMAGFIQFGMTDLTINRYGFGARVWEKGLELMGFVPCLMCYAKRNKFCRYSGLLCR